MMALMVCDTNSAISTLHGLFVNDKIISGKDIKSSFYLFYLIPFIIEPLSLILLPLRLESPMHKNPQRRKIIHGMCPVGCKHRSIELNMCFCRNILLIYFLWQLLWLLFNTAYFF